MSAVAGQTRLTCPDRSGDTPLCSVSYLTDSPNFPAQDCSDYQPCRRRGPAVTTDHIRVPWMNADSPPDRSGFDPSTTSLLITAFEGAWAAVLKSGSPLASAEQAAETREFLARYIIDHVEAGERDPQKLIDDVLASLATPR